ncbi:MAG: phosphoenolpyruvate--protein phosphotransferase [Rhodospirillales bacterium]|nr:phosphoenolpyruvate--protein phosphotransferase [Rhodospirillales bacterium]
MSDFVREDRDRNERVIHGLAAASGVGLGRAYLREPDRLHVPRYRIAAQHVEDEQRRLAAAIARARRRVARIRARAASRAKLIPEMGAEELGYLFDAYVHILKDSRLVRGAMARIGTERINAEDAVRIEVGLITDAFKRMDDAYLSARIEDIREIGNRLIAFLLKKEDVKPITALPKGCVLVAEELRPADTAQLDPDIVVGLAAQIGSPQGHTAIMARALGLPAVLGAGSALAEIETGDLIAIDGDRGEIIVHPSQDSLRAIRRRIDQLRAERKQLRRLAKRPAVTLDGIEISLRANVELPFEMDSVANAGAEGVGLLRTEFLFLNRATVPTEDEQAAALIDVVERARGRQVTIRTLDLGGDKSSSDLITRFGESAASALGLRGIRLSIACPEMLEIQFRAILRAFAHGPVQILLPMVTSVQDIRTARDLLARAARTLHRRNEHIPHPLPPLGTMIEVPGAALSADALAQVSDFFAIGSNDLTMYTLAIDRSDEHVAHLYNPLHPAVLRLIQFASAAAVRARIPISICGEVAGDPRFTALLVGLGFRELSMTASSIPAVKRRILGIDRSSAVRRANLIMSETDPSRIEALLDDVHEAA